MRREARMKPAPWLVMLSLVVALVACESVKHAASVQERSSLSPENAYVGGEYGTIVGASARLYCQVVGGGTIAIDLPGQSMGGRSPTMFLAELPPSEYRVDHLTTTTLELGGVANLGIPELSSRPIKAVLGQVVHIGSISVGYSPRLLLSVLSLLAGGGGGVKEYGASSRIDPAASYAFEQWLRQAYDVPASIRIVDVTE